MRNKNKKRWLIFLLCPILIFLAVAWIVMLLWNCLLPEIMGFKTVTFWQASGILILSKILFGGFHGKFGRGMRDFKERKMRERMNGLSPEERDKFKQVWKSRCESGFFGRNKKSDED